MTWEEGVEGTRVGEGRGWREVGGRGRGGALED